MNISDALTLASIPHTVDSRAKYRQIPKTGPALNSVYVIGDETATALSKALALEECPLLYVSATGHVLVLRLGDSGSVAIEAVDTPTDPQTAVLAEVGKASYEFARVAFRDFYEVPSGSRKKVKPDPVAPIEPDPVAEIAADPVLDEVDSSEPTE